MKSVATAAAILTLSALSLSAGCAGAGGGGGVSRGSAESAPAPSPGVGGDRYEAMSALGYQPQWNAQATLARGAKMAFFDAYGSIAGAAGIAALEAILSPRGLLRRKEQPETRACAVVALSRIGTPEARQVLESAADDKELMVRNAVNKALREAAR